VSADVNCIHHVVWCIEPQSLGRVRELWEGALGLPLQEVDLPELGVVILISWAGGIEIMSPVHPTGELAAMARAFLAERGEGVFSVVFNVADIDGAVDKVGALGGSLLFRDEIPAAEFDDREIAGDGPATRHDIRQALFDEFSGLRLCLQQLVPKG
jgi:hypothetical protein